MGDEGSERRLWCKKEATIRGYIFLKQSVFRDSGFDSRGLVFFAYIHSQEISDLDEDECKQYLTSTFSRFLCVFVFSTS